jgi:voltage-gated potassium channel Kch
LKVNKIRYLVLELNPHIAPEEKKNGEPVFFGDSTDSEILEHAGIRAAMELTRSQPGK